MELIARPISPSASPEARVDRQISANTQLPTPNPSPPGSPKLISPAKAWLLSVSATPEELGLSSSSQSSPNCSFNSTPSQAEEPTFINDFFEARTSPKGGLGAFAVVDIPKGTVIMAEEPLFRADPVEIYWKYEALNDEQRKEYRTLSCWFGIEDQRVPAIFTTNRFVFPRMTQIS
jgi:hypothetical protein